VSLAMSAFAALSMRSNSHGRQPDRHQLCYCQEGRAPTVVHFRNRMPVVPDDEQFAGCRGLSALAEARGAGRSRAERQAVGGRRRCGPGEGERGDRVTRSRQAVLRALSGRQRRRQGGRAASALCRALQVENQRGVYLAAEASAVSAQASASQARLAADANLDGVNTTVARLQAEVQQAQYDLDQTTFRAPTDGYVTQLFLRPGMMAVPLPLRPVMVFVHAEYQRLFAAFQQNALQRIDVRRPGRGRLRCDSRPGLLGQGQSACRRRLAGAASADRRVAEPGEPRGVRARPGRNPRDRGHGEIPSARRTTSC
jgi:hypothetical protein